MLCQCNTLLIFIIIYYISVICCTTIIFVCHVTYFQPMKNQYTYKVEDGHFCKWAGTFVDYTHRHKSLLTSQMNSFILYPSICILYSKNEYGLRKWSILFIWNDHTFQMIYIFLNSNAFSLKWSDTQVFFWFFNLDSANYIISFQLGY